MAARCARCSRPAAMPQSGQTPGASSGVQVVGREAGSPARSNEPAARPSRTAPRRGRAVACARRAAASACASSQSGAALASRAATISDRRWRAGPRGDIGEQSVQQRPPRCIALVRSRGSSGHARASRARVDRRRRRAASSCNAPSAACCASHECRDQAQVVADVRGPSRAARRRAARSAKTRARSGRRMRGIDRDVSVSIWPGSRMRCVMGGSRGACCRDGYRKSGRRKGRKNVVARLPHPSPLPRSGRGGIARDYFGGASPLTASRNQAGDASTPSPASRCRASSRAPSP